MFLNILYCNYFLYLFLPYPHTHVYICIINDITKPAAFLSVKYYSVNYCHLQLNFRASKYSAGCLVGF